MWVVSECLPRPGAKTTTWVGLRMFASMSRAFPKHLIGDHEIVVFDLNPHWLRLAAMSVPAVLLAIGGLVLTIVLGDFGFWQTVGIGAGLLTGAGLWCAAQYLIWSRTHFVLTNTRIVVRVGVISKRSTEIPLSRINSVRCSQNPFERLVRVGDLHVESASLDGVNIISDVRDPERVRGLINEQSSAVVLNTRVPTPGPTPAPAASPHRSVEADIAAKIAELAELCNQGIITDSEFANKKTELLARM